MAPTSHRTLHDRVLGVLGPAIAGGDYAPGDMLTLEQIEQQFGVSRTVAREAVRVLQSMGMVVSRPRTGVTVSDQAEWNVFDPQLIRWRMAGRGRNAQLRSLTELRAAVEPSAAALAAERASPQQRARLAELGPLMREAGRAGDLEAFLTLDIEFHRLLLASSGNEMMAGLSEVIEEVLIGRTVHHLMPPQPEEKALRLHALVASSIETSDADVARVAMHGIVTEVGAAVAETRSHPPDTSPA
ncbi:GntR family transcriptional regulator [Halopolyspora algeriensis]|uniref:GntR family transcriptional regulator n=1 Tax=Halopolyspora algeriensis TaxID=1500506 RepID=A0A368VQ40_9ACTN|nr:FCD domain-containing protein [Halopolyspora algeriensis]RCW43145.1 GntR family transcriptional regulator [Halopolyspora algeriensis]TQM56203.1 GntR family transcriptional regulator [Halopolyspora algeriensis]